MLGSGGQIRASFLALRPDIVPQVWTDELRTLESAVPAQEAELVHETIQSLREESRRVFANSTINPSGAVSIGQVHRAAR